LKARGNRVLPKLLPPGRKEGENVKGRKASEGKKSSRVGSKTKHLGKKGREVRLSDACSRGEI